MGTRGMIGCWDETTNKVTATYCHYDSYPEHVGWTLLNYYNGPLAAAAVSNAGYLSGLHMDLELAIKESANKDESSLYNSVEEYLADAWDETGAEFIYLWDGFSWFVADRDTKLFTDVETILEDK